MNAEKIKLEIISIAQTFVGFLFLELGYAASQVPLEQLASKEFWGGATLVALASGVVRSAVKLTWQKFMPVKLGGKAS